jgi:putative membrane protein
MNMLKKLVSFAVIGLVGWTGCSKDSSSSQAPGASQGSETAPPEEATRSGKMAALTDGQILQVLANVDSGEIEQAQVALTKATSPAVRQFAQHMLDQHTQSKQEGQTLASETKIIPSPSEPAQEVRTKGATVLDKLNTADTASFDSTYMNSQLQQHKDVLKMLDEKLLPSASSPELRTTLEKVKAMVQHHIEMAQQIQA